MSSLLHDFCYAVRSCLRTPGFTFIAVAALALGIGANTAIFAVVNAVMLEPLPFRDASRLVAVWEENAQRPGRPNTVAPANFLRWRDRASAFEQLSAMADYRANLVIAGESPEELDVQLATPDFFRTLGVAPLRGRTFTEAEGGPSPQSENDVAILSYGLWARRFGNDSSIVGRAIQLGGRPVIVVGVMPPGFGVFLKAGSLTGKPADLWVPLLFDEGDRRPRGRYLSAVARLKPGVGLREAQAQMDTIAAGLRAEWPQFDTGWSVRLVPLRTELAGELSPALLVLMGAVVFVLLIACANVANLLLARGASRRREIAIRTALGAGRGRLVRLLIAESLTLSLAGGAAGLLLAGWGVPLLLAISPVDLSADGAASINYLVLLFAVAVSVCTAVICGVVPAFESASGDVHAGLKDGAREAGSAVRGRRFRHGFVVAELALALVLLAGAGLLIRSFANLRGVAPGFRTGDVLTARMSLPAAKYAKAAQRTGFFREAVQRVAALPGVRAAGVVSFLPFAGLGAATDFTIEGQPDPLPGHEGLVDVRVCDDGYFTAMGIPLVRGRLFTEREMLEPSDVVIVNAALARHYFPDQDPIGRRLLIDMKEPMVPTTIIGVVGDVRYVDLATEPRAMAYWPHPLLPYSAMTLAVRGDTGVAALAPAIERRIQALDPEQPLSDVRTMDEWVGRSLARARFSGLMLALFAGMALVLACIGIYGVMSYAVSQRTGEIGVRVALGAVNRDIVRMVIGTGVRLTVLGLGLGIVLAIVLRRALTALLFGIPGSDPATLAGGAAVLGAIAMLACYLPARRAARIEPVEALREQ